MDIDTKWADIETTLYEVFRDVYCAIDDDWGGVLDPYIQAAEMAKAMVVKFQIILDLPRVDRSKSRPFNQLFDLIWAVENTPVSAERVLRTMASDHVLQTNEAEHEKWKYSNDVTRSLVDTVGLRSLVEDVMTGIVHETIQNRADGSMSALSLPEYELEVRVIIPEA